MPISIGTLGLEASSDRFDGPQSKGPPPGSTFFEHAAQALLDQFPERGPIADRHPPGFLEQGVGNIDCRFHIANNICLQGRCQRFRKGACHSYAGLDWIVTADTVVRPDVMVVCGSQPGRHLERPSALAIEILGDATAEKDRTAKRRLYELAGVGHYLLVDPLAKTIEWLALGAEGTYHDRSADIAEAERFSLTLPDGCRIDMDRGITFS